MSPKDQVASPSSFAQTIPQDQDSRGISVWLQFATLAFRGVFVCVRGAFKSNFWKNLGIWPNQVDPPPLPQSWDPQN